MATVPFKGTLLDWTIDVSVTTHLLDLATICPPGINPGYWMWRGFSFGWRVTTKSGDPELRSVVLLTRIQIGDGAFLASTGVVGARYYSPPYNTPVGLNGSFRSNTASVQQGAFYGLPPHDEILMITQVGGTGTLSLDVGYLGLADT